MKSDSYSSFCNTSRSKHMITCLKLHILWCVVHLREHYLYTSSQGQFSIGRRLFEHTRLCGRRGFIRKVTVDKQSSKILSGMLDDCYTMNNG